MILAPYTEQPLTLRGPLQKLACSADTGKMGGEALNIQKCKQACILHYLHANQLGI